MTLFAAIFVLIGWDLLQDYGAGASGIHMALEAGVLMLTVSGIFLLLRRRMRDANTVKALRRDLELVERDSQQWRADSRKLIQGLGMAIEQQFERWGLTSAESEVALLLIKGLSLKEIAGLRDTSERTTRDQAQGVYRKAGVGGRSQLAAFFLEDLLLPSVDR